MNINEFLKMFGSDVMFCHQYSKSSDSGMNFNVTLEQLLETNNKGFDAYFIPNGGGTKKTEITNFNSCFIDLDTGKRDGKYLPEQEVNIIKKRMLEEIKHFSLKPSIIVETRNGYHVYWLLKETRDIDASMWEDLQRRLVDYFESLGADKSIIKPNQLMRLPYTKWYKPWTGEDPFEVKVVELNGTRYNIEDLNKVLPLIKKVIRTTYASTNKYEVSSINKNIEFIKACDVEGLRREIEKAANHCVKQNPDNIIGLPTIYLDYKSISNCGEFYFNLQKPVIVRTRQDFYDLISQLPLDLILGLPSDRRFRCIFHDDHTPSAHIYLNTKGQYRYKCFGNKCGFNGDLINIVSKIQGTDIVDTINYIKAVFNITYETEWQAEAKQRLLIYEDYILSESFSTNFPVLFKFIEPHIPKLKAFLEMARLKVMDKNVIEDARMVFSVSTRYLSEEMIKRDVAGIRDIKTLHKRIQLFVYLGLIDKVTEAEIPKELLEKLKEISVYTTSSGKTKKARYHIGLFAIPRFSHKLLDDAQKKVLQFTDSKMTKTNLSRNMIYATEGKGSADRIYTQDTDNGVSKTFLKFYCQYKAVAEFHIGQQGYFTETQLVRKIRGYEKREKERYSRESMPRLIRELKVKPKRVNARSRRQFNIPESIPSNSVIYVKETEL